MILSEAADLAAPSDSSVVAFEVAAVDELVADEAER